MAAGFHSTRLSRVRISGLSGDVYLALHRCGQVHVGFSASVPGQWESGAKRFAELCSERRRCGFLDDQARYMVYLVGAVPAACIVSHCTISLHPGHSPSGTLNDHSLSGWRKTTSRTMLSRSRACSGLADSLQQRSAKGTSREGRYNKVNTVKENQVIRVEETKSVLQAPSRLGDTIVRIHTFSCGCTDRRITVVWLIAISFSLS